MKTALERYEYHNQLFNKWFEKVFMPATEAFRRGDLTSQQYLVYQNKKKMLLQNIDMAEAALHKKPKKGLI